MILFSVFCDCPVLTAPGWPLHLGLCLRTCLEKSVGSESSTQVRKAEVWQRVCSSCTDAGTGALMLGADALICTGRRAPESPVHPECTCQQCSKSTLGELGCIGLSSPLVVQGLCHRDTGGRVLNMFLILPRPLWSITEFLLKAEMTCNSFS